MIRLAGYAARFDRIDRGGDTIVRGAFAQSLAAHPAPPLLLEHRPDQPVGWIERLFEDGLGLAVIARLPAAGGDPARRAARALLVSPAGAGLSFGYRVRRSSGAAPRRLERLDLAEVSLVAMPMQPSARVHAFVAIPDVSIPDSLKG